MNRNCTILILLMAVACIGYSQNKSKTTLTFQSNVEKTPLIQNKFTNEHNLIKSPQLNHKVFGDTLFYEDFDGGLPNGWTIVNNDSSINNNSWLWDTVAKSGQFTTNVPAIQSTTASNGFMSLPSDFYNTPQSGFPSSMNTYFESDTITISPKNSVWVSYQQLLIYCCRDAVLTTGIQDVNIFLQVSTDNFQTFTNFLANDGLPSNVYLNNGATNMINISSAVRDSSKFKVRFYARGITRYLWYIDDFAVIEGPQFDMAISNEKLEFNASNHVFNPSYSQIPYLLFQPLPFSATIINNGGTIEDGARLEASVSHTTFPSGTAGAGLVYFNYSIPDTITLDTSALATTKKPDFISPNIIGDFQVDFLVRGNNVDQNLGNETASESFTITDTVYAKDDGEYRGTTGTGNYLRQGQLGGTTAGDKYGTKFIFEPIFNLSLTNRIPTSITFGISGNSINIGAEIVPKIWLFKEDSLFSPTVTSLDQAVIQEVASSFVPRLITANDTNTLVTVGFDNGSAVFNGLNANEQYIVGYEVANINNGNSNVELFNDVSTSATQPEYNTFLNMAHAPGWESINDNPVIRLNMGNFARIIIGLNESDNSNVELKVLPSLNKGLFKVEVYSKEQKKYNLNVRNLLGQIVYNEMVQVNGNFVKKLDLSYLEKGVYFVNMENDSERIIKKIVIQ